MSGYPFEPLRWYSAPARDFELARYVATGPRGRHWILAHVEHFGWRLLTSELTALGAETFRELPESPYPGRREATDAADWHTAHGFRKARQK
jgi:hypothetical protein